MKTQLGNMLAEKRARKKMTRAQMAESLSMSDAHMYYIESAKRDVVPSVIKRIHSVYFSDIDINKFYRVAMANNRKIKVDLSAMDRKGRMAVIDALIGSGVF